MTYRPLSSRGVPDERFDGPQPGLPDYLLYPVLEWVERLLRRPHPRGYGTTPDTEFLKAMQVALRMETPLSWVNGGDSAIASLRAQLVDDREFALDVLDFLLHFGATADQAKALGGLLTMGGSEWEVVPTGDGSKHSLSKRVIGPVRESIDEIRTHNQRAHHHLSTAWEKLVGRNPDPSAAYREAIKAVEVVAKPVITPNDPVATLGKIIKAINDAPDKWLVVLDKSSPEDVARMAGLIWKGQQDRHGTDDNNAPLTVSQAEADAAVHIAVPLVRLFATGGIRPK